MRKHGDRPHPCGNPNCATSTHIGDCLTFGSGELDDNGFWEFPCYICAQAAYDRDLAAGRTEYMPYWPETPKMAIDAIDRAIKKHKERIRKHGEEIEKLEAQKAKHQETVAKTQAANAKVLI